jgi:uncharacterized protein (DUF1501 family)
MNRKLSRRGLLVASTQSGLCFAAGVAAAEPKPVHVLLWLRGGADGLSLVVPYRDDDYFRARPSTALAPPGHGVQAAIALSDCLAMHPGFAPLRAWFEQGEATWVPGVGARELIHSHSSAERGVRASVARCVGAAEACESFTGSLQEQFAELARRIRVGTAPRIAWVEAGGWDTHAGQGSGMQGLLAARVVELTCSLRAFRGALGQRWANIRLLAFSEFGRTLQETPLFGTGDGYAAAALLVGGQPFERSVLGTWPSLAPAALVEKRHVRPSLTLDALLGSWWRSRP